MVGGGVHLAPTANGFTTVNTLRQKTDDFQEKSGFSCDFCSNSYINSIIYKTRRFSKTKEFDGNSIKFKFYKQKSATGNGEKVWVVTV